MQGGLALTSPREVKTVRVADDSAPKIQVSAGMLTLRVIAPTITDHGFEQIQFHAGLRELDFSRAPLTNNMLGKLSGGEFPRLKTLRLAGCVKLLDVRLTPFLLDLRKKGVRLELLDLRHLPNLANSSVVEIGQHSSLRVVLLRGCPKPNDIGFRELKLPGLVRLDVGGTQITHGSVDTMMEEWWTHLEEFGVAWCEGLSLKGLPDWTPFRESRIRLFDARRKKPMTAEEASAVVKGIPEHMSDLRFPRMTEDPKNFLGDLNPKLPYRALDLSSFQGLTDALATRLLKTLDRSTLRELHLSGCKRLNWRFFGNLVKWLGQSRLNCLSLEGTSLGDAALGNLSKHPFETLNIAYCRGLSPEVFGEVELNARSLDVSGLPVTDATVVEMLSQKELTRLNLRDTQVTMVGVLDLLSRKQVGQLTLPSDEVVIEGGKWTHRQFFALTRAFHTGITRISVTGLEGLKESSWNALARSCPASLEHLAIDGCRGFTLAHLKSLVSRATNLQSVVLSNLEGLYKEAAFAALNGKVKQSVVLELRKAADSPRAKLAEARELLEMGGEDADRAIATLKKLKDTLPEALYWYGRAIFEGKGGLEPDEKTGRSLVLEAAALNCPLAFITRGLWVIEGGDLGTGVGWLRRAAEADLDEAKYLCFLHARKDKKLVQNDDIKRLKEAADSDHAGALFLNGLRIWTGKHLLPNERKNKKWGRQRIEWASRQGCKEASEWLETHKVTAKKILTQTLSRMSGNGGREKRRGSLGGFFGSE